MTRSVLLAVALVAALGATVAAPWYTYHEPLIVIIVHPAP